MSVIRYIPYFQERHYDYRNAFENCSNIIDYYFTITDYLENKNLSSSNDDDVELFKDLLFESKFSKVHLNYSDWLINSVKNKILPISILDNYIRYMCQISSLHSGDFWKIFLVEGNELLIEDLLKITSSNMRTALVEAAVQYNTKIMKTISKLKIYLIFS